MLTFLAVAAQTTEPKGDLTGLILLIVAMLFLGGGAKAASSKSSSSSQPRESDDWVPIRLRDSSGRVTTYETPRSSLRAQGAPSSRSNQPTKAGSRGREPLNFEDELRGMKLG